MPVMHASLGISVLLSAKIVLNAGAMNISFYCNSGKDGGMCHRCSKCLRKELAVRAACELSNVNVFQSSLIPTTPWSERYSAETISEVFGKNVVEYRHATIGCSRILHKSIVNREGIPQGLLENQLSSPTARHHRTDFLRHHWASGLRFVGGHDEFLHFAEKRFSEYNIPRMTTDEEEQLHKWVVEAD